MRGCSGARKGADSGTLDTSFTGAHPPYCLATLSALVGRHCGSSVEWHGGDEKLWGAALGLAAADELVWIVKFFDNRLTMNWGFLRFNTVKTCNGCFPQKVFLCSNALLLIVFLFRHTLDKSLTVSSQLTHSRSSTFKKSSQDPDPFLFGCAHPHGF